MARILLVDDDGSLLTRFESFLQSKGHTVVTAISGLNALMILTSNTFDVIVTDRSMPGMSGIDLMGVIRLTNGTTPIILHTNTFIGRSEETNLLRMGFSAICTKDVLGSFEKVYKIILSFLK